MSTQMRRACTFIAVVGSVALFNGESPLSAAAAVDCTVAALQQKAPAGTKITSATTVEAAGGLPQYCRVEGNVETPGNTVNFRLGLPAAWNNKFRFEGVGGFGGSIGSINEGLRRGYATASTDTGHQGDADDAAWALNNRPKEIDFAHRGAHVTTVAAKHLTEAYYAAAPRYSYFAGCSGGGRMALMEAYQYPDDYDGILAGAPGLAYQRIKRGLVFQTLLASPDRWVPPAKIQMLSKAVLEACDANDGLKDGLSLPLGCNFKLDTLKCAGPDGPNCFTAAQLETIKAVNADVRMGKQLVRGFPISGHEAEQGGWISWHTGSQAPVATEGKLEFKEKKSAPRGISFMDTFFRHLGFEVDDPTYDWRTFNLERDFSKVVAMSDLIVPAADLRKFKESGGKVMIYHGWGDAAVSPLMTMDFYDAAARGLGGQKKAEETARLFMVPGMQHCGGGSGPNTFDMFTDLENWVERGVAPKQVVASHAVNGVVDRTRPLCPHPQVARYVGSGSIDAAENFRCEAPR